MTLYLYTTKFKFDVRRSKCTVAIRKVSSCLSLSPNPETLQSKSAFEIKCGPLHGMTYETRSNSVGVMFLVKHVGEHVYNSVHRAGVLCRVIEGNARGMMACLCGCGSLDGHCEDQHSLVAAGEKMPATATVLVEEHLIPHTQSLSAPSGP